MSRLFVHDCGGSKTPVADVYELYASGTAGSDANSGADWANAFRTTSKLLSEVRKALIEFPASVSIVCHLRHRFEDQDLIWNVPTIGSSRVYFVHDRDQMTVVEGAIGVASLLPGDTNEHGLAALELDAVPGADYRGYSVRLRDMTPGSTESFVATVVRQDDNVPAIWVTVDRGQFPVWVDATSEVDFLEPDVRIDGTLALIGIGGAPSGYVDQASGVLNATSMAFFLKADNIVLQGDWVGCAGCMTEAADVLLDGTLSMTGGSQIADFGRVSAGGISAYVDDALIQAWGVYTGTVPPASTEWSLGNGCGNVAAAWTAFGTFSGYSKSAIRSFGCSTLRATRCSSISIHGGPATGQGGASTAPSGAQIAVDKVILFGSNSWSALYAEYGAVVKFRNVTFDEVPAQHEALIRADVGGHCDAASDSLDLYVDGVPNYAGIGVWSNGGYVSLRGGYPDALIADGNQILTTGDGVVFAYPENPGVTRAIDLTTVRPGNGTDLAIVHGRLIVKGNIHKEAPNTQPRGFIEVGPGSILRQELPADVLTHGPAPADWANAYGAGRFVYVHSGGQAHFGQVSDGGVGAGAGLAIEIRRNGLITFLTGGGGLTAAAAALIQIGASAATVAWNDAAWQGDTAVAGANENCGIGPR